MGGSLGDGGRNAARQSVQATCRRSAARYRRVGPLAPIGGACPLATAPGTLGAPHPWGRPPRVSRPEARVPPPP